MNNTSVIDDTVNDLPGLLTMTPEDRQKWYASLGTLERAQLNKVCGIVIGLTLAEPIIEMLSQLNRKKTP